MTPPHTAERKVQASLWPIIHRPYRSDKRVSRLILRPETPEQIIDVRDGLRTLLGREGLQACLPLPAEGSRRHWRHRTQMQ